MLHRVLSKVLLLGLAAVVFLCISSESVCVCPPPRLTQPCECQKIGSECVLLCNQLKNQLDLAHVLERSSDYAFDTLSIKYSSFSFLPPSLFERKDLKLINIWYSSMIAILRRALPFNHTLEFLSLNEAKILRGVLWDQLAPFTNLKRLSILHMSLPQLGQAFMSYAPKAIERLMLYNTSTSELDDAIFASRTNLLEIALQYGQVQTLKRSMFPEDCKLTSIDFNQNLIETLPDDLFSNMPFLGALRLSNNKIKEMTENIFGSIFSNLNYFTLEGNPVRCGCSIRWVTFLEKHPRIYEGKCSEPLELRDRKLRDLRQEDFVHCRT